MDYKEKYELALERARKLYERGTITESLGHVFPELCESEDERIRKMLIEFFGKGAENNSSTNGISDKDILSWLEKQVENNPYSGVSFKYNGHTWGMCARDNGVEILVDGEIKERVFLGSKPQGKSALEAINEEKVDNANKVELNDYSSIDPHFGKPIDNVEPKFHDGQWIVWQGKYFKVNYNGCRYELTDQNGKNTSLEYGTIDETAHLWNISDAKAGDVRATEDIVFIFKHKDKTGLSLCKSYCEVIGNSELGLGFDFSINGVYPASKEQRDTLLKAMANAGYTFDFKKNELKKIEQNPAWSEDDMFKVQRICKYLDEAKKYYADITEVRECIDWLKSLRPQNTWKPSDEQLDALQYVYRNCNPPLSDKLGWNSLKTLELMYQDLKKL